MLLNIVAAGVEPRMSKAGSLAEHRELSLPRGPRSNVGRGSESDRCGVLAFVAPDSGLPGQMKSSCMPNYAELICSRFHCSTAKFCPVIDYRSRLNSREPSSLQWRDALPLFISHNEKDCIRSALVEDGRVLAEKQREHFGYNPLN